MEGGHGWLASSSDVGDKTRNMAASDTAASVHHHYCHEVKASLSFVTSTFKRLVI
jgi:hypothetical protein